MLKRKFIKSNDYIEYLNWLKVRYLYQDYTRSALINNTIETYLNCFIKLEDAEENVPAKFLKKQRLLIFKEFKKQWKLDNKRYKKYTKIYKTIFNYENKQKLLEGVKTWQEKTIITENQEKETLENKELL